MNDTHFWLVFGVVFGPFFLWAIYELYAQYRDFVRGDL